MPCTEPKSKHAEGLQKLLICADAGGSNGYRLRLWKRELQQSADTHKIVISVCHFPPGTSKWNKIEHRLFSFISLNWRGKPLTSYQGIINLIASTTTKTGLTIKARSDEKLYTIITNFFHFESSCHDTVSSGMMKS